MTAFQQSPKKVVQFLRRSFPGQVSIEKVFEQVRKAWSSPEFEVVPLHAPQFSKGLFPRIENMRWAARHQGDVNHITGDVHYMALGLAPTRTVLTVCDCVALTKLKGLKRFVGKRYWFDLPVKHVAAVTVISNEVMRELVNYVPAAHGKTYVIPCAVAPIYQPSPRPFRSLRPKILQIGYTPNKNLERVILALEGLECDLLVIGRQPEEVVLKARKHGVSLAVKHSLSDEEMYECYCDADIVSFPSTYEGFGLPIVEGQWVERPVLTSNCSSMPEIAGEGACLVDPFDVASIRAGFRRIIEDESYRNSLVEKGKINRLRFSYSAVAKQYADLYRTILTSNSNKN